MSLIQIVLLISILFIWFRLYQKYRVNELATREFVEWFLLWLAAGFVVVVPDFASYVAFVLGVGRGSDLVVYLALVLVFYLLFKLFTRQERHKQELTRLVRELALRDSKMSSSEDNRR